MFGKRTLTATIALAIVLLGALPALADGPAYSEGNDKSPAVKPK